MSRLLAMLGQARAATRKPVPTPLAALAGLAVLVGSAVISRWLAEREQEYLARAVRLAALAAEVAQAEEDAAEAGAELPEMHRAGRTAVLVMPRRTPDAEYPAPDDLDPLGRGDTNDTED